MAIQWDPSLSVGVKQIDEQHQELFRRVNELVDAMHRGQSKAQLGEMLSFLSVYVVQHFGAEEKLMSERWYPGAGAHRRQHADFVKTLGRVKADFDARGATSQLAIAVNTFVCTWLREHVAGSDRELGRFLEAAGAPLAR